MKTASNSEKIRRCLKCILPGNYPGISFGQDGICNFCRDWIEITYNGVEEFTKKLSDNKRNGKYDCLVPVSGGRDSAFVLHEMVARFGVKVLAYNYDNGFVCQQAKLNLQEMTRKLGVDLVTVKSEKNLQVKMVGLISQLAIKKSPCHFRTYLCSYCGMGIWGGAYKVAREKSIPVIVFGESAMEAAKAKKVHEENYSFSKRDKIYSAVSHPVNFFLRKYYASEWAKEFPDDSSGICVLNFYDYIKWDEEKILNTIESELGWQSTESGKNWRIDCEIHTLVDALDRAIYGFTEKDDLYSKMIRNGELSRDEAILRVAQSSSSVELDYIKVLGEKLELNENEIEDLLNFLQNSKGSSC